MISIPSALPRKSFNALSLIRYAKKPRMTLGYRVSMMALSVSVLFIIKRWMRLNILSSKPYASVIPWFDCHDPCRSVSREPNIHSGSFNNAEQFSFDVSFNIHGAFESSLHGLLSQ